MAERLGYHYTSAAALRKILREGLQPRPHPQLEKLGIREPVIWLWPEQLRGKAHWGQLLWTMVRWGTPRVVVLAVLYHDEDVLSGVHGVTHSGDMKTPYNTFTYHVGEPAVLLTRAVPQFRLALVGSYDIRAQGGKPAPRPKSRTKGISQKEWARRPETIARTASMEEADD